MPDPLLDYRARLLERLEAIVPELADAVAAIAEEQWHTPGPAGQRSPHASIAHLRDVERHAYLVRLRRLLAEEHPTFELFDPPDWETSYYQPTEPMTNILADYAGVRESELQILRNLAIEQWARQGRHTTLGVRAVQWWVERMLEYAEDRLKELKEH
jgi:hypothetical protein